MQNKGHLRRSIELHRRVQIFVVIFDDLFDGTLGSDSAANRPASSTIDHALVSRSQYR